MSRRKAALVALGLAVTVAACGMRGGSRQTIIDGLATGAGSGAALSGGGGSATTGTGTSGNSPDVALTASAPGITPTTIRIGTIQDISGPVPGLFETALDGVKAWVAYENSRGGIDGRKIVLDTYDAGLNPSKFQQSMAQACTSDFALVGVMSTVDNNGAIEGQQCGIPDIADNPTTPQAAAGNNVFAADPSLPNSYPDSFYKWVKQGYPQVVSHAGIMWIGMAITELTGQRIQDTAESVGFHFVYHDTTSIVEANFLPYIQSMKSDGVQFFVWQADYQSMARILQAMQQLNWRPTVVEDTQTAYNQEFLSTAGSAANGTFIDLNVGLFSEAKYNPAIKTYLSWLDKTVPGHAPPDIFGIYSWAAGVLAAEALNQAGANPTRAQMLNALQGIHSFNGGGIMAPMDPGNHKATPCFEVVTVKNGQFVRVYPTQPDSYDCTLGSIFTDPKIPQASISGS